MAGGVAEKFFLAFQDIFWRFSSRCLPITSSGQTQRETRQPVFIVLHGLKDYGVVLKTDKGCHDFRWYPSQFLQTLVFLFA